MARSLGLGGLPCYVGFLCKSKVERQRGIESWGAAGSPCCGRVLLYPTSLWRGAIVLG